MNQRKYAALWTILILLTFSFLIFSVVSADSNAARGGPQAQGINTPSVSPSTSQQPLSCSNPQQCREIDEVWQRIGPAVRGSSEIWDVSTTTFGWRAFTAVHGSAVAPVVQPSQPGAVVQDLCFPLTQDSYTGTNRADWGSKRDQEISQNVVIDRCHAGNDLLQKDPGKVIAITDGKVTNIIKSWYNCDGGWGIINKQERPVAAVLIYHPSLGITVNYGEIDDDAIAPGLSIGKDVKKGQFLGRASYCSTLHMEVYGGEVKTTDQWMPPTGTNINSDNQCANEHYPLPSGSKLQDPRLFIKSLEGKYCTITG